MAHQLKYYKEIDSHGHLWRVEILQDTEDTLTPTEIGPVLQGLRLVMQGDQADIDTPIVKTSLEMTFVDAPDLEEERKCGYWEEFYTSSATEFKVVLYKDGQPEWSGFITPDSFSEDLRYRGSVIIIARDNLGHLQDYDANIQNITNTEGRVSILALLKSALTDLGIIAMDWETDKTGLSRAKLSSEWGDTTFSQMVDAESLSDLNMYQVLEKLLYSIGANIRYIGGNRLQVSIIRNMGLMSHDFWGDVATKEALFKAHGHRELSPAARVIEEAVEFQTEHDASSYAMKIDAYADQGNITQMVINMGGTQTIPVHAYANGSLKQYVGINNSMLLDPSRYAKHPTYSSEKFGQWNDTSILYCAMNTQRPVQFRSRVFDTQGLTVTCRCRIDHPVTFFDSECTTLGNLPLDKNNIYYGGTIAFRIVYHSQDLTEVLYYTDSNQWSASAATITRAVYDSWNSNSLQYPVYDGNSYEFADISVPGPGYITFEVYRIYAATIYTGVFPCYGAYARISRMSIDHVHKIEDKSRLTIKTNYSDKNNIKLTRTPDYAPATTARYNPVYYKNSLAILDDDGQYRTGEQWRFNDMDAPQQLAVLIHQQILAYYSKPNNVLTGELMDAGGSFPDFQSIWRWNGKNHLLTSGTLNILTGRMENAVLREFMRYDHMWETWAETETHDIDYKARSVWVPVHSNRELSIDDISGLPAWITAAAVTHPETNTYRYLLNVMENASGAERSVIFSIDTAWVRITQRAAGDYNVAYGTDYS